MKRPPRRWFGWAKAETVANKTPRFQSLRRLRWERILLFSAALIVLAVSAPLNTTIYGMNVVLGLLLAAVHAGSLLLSYFQPWTGMVISLIVVLATAVFNQPTEGAVGPFTVIGMLTQLTIIVISGLRASWYVAALCWLGTLAAVTYGGSWIRGVQFGNQETGSLVVFASVGFGLLAASIIARQWQLIRTQLTVERGVSASEVARRQIVEDRAGIARELHDVVAHGMSLVTVQATTARYRYPDLDKKVVAEFEEIAEHSRRAMTEMRHILGVLRAEDSQGETRPQPGVNDLKALVESIRRAGIAVDISLPHNFEPGSVLGLTVYRIVQEALSNVVRHAPNSRATVRISQSSEQLVVLVENNATATLATEKTGGHGLIGMRERTQAVGGTLEYGPSVNGGFRVEARLPRDLGSMSDAAQRKNS